MQIIPTDFHLIPDIAPLASNSRFALKAYEGITSVPDAVAGVEELREYIFFAKLIIRPKKTFPYIHIRIK